VGASVIAGVDAAPVLEAPEHDLDLMAMSMERDIVRDGDLAVGFGGMQAVVPRAASAWRNQSAS
jgi:hypothetical protein